MEDLSVLIVAARKGDNEAYEVVVRRFQDMAVGYAYGLLGDWQEAEDASQDVGVYHLLTDVPQCLVQHGADLSAREAGQGRTALELAQSPFEDETDRAAVIALLEAAQMQENASDGSAAGVGLCLRDLSPTRIRLLKRTHKRRAGANKGDRWSLRECVYLFALALERWLEFALTFANEDVEPEERRADEGN